MASTIGSVAASASARDQHRKRSSGILCDTSTQTDAASSASRQSGSTFSGDTTVLAAGNNANLTGSNIVSDNGTVIVAKNDLSIQSASNTTAESHFREDRKSGIFSSGGMGITLGRQQQSTDQQSVTRTAAASMVGSTQGDIELRAGKNYVQTGSAIIAPQGTIDIRAQKVDIHEARETGNNKTESRFKQSGLTVAITSPVISAVQTTQQMSQATSDTSDPRMKALAAANIVLAGKEGIDAIRDDAANKLGGVKLALSIGSTKSQSQSTQSSDAARGSTVAAGKNINITAGGAGQDSNITVHGSNVQASKRVVLNAENEIRLLAAKNTVEQHSTNSSKSSSVGVGIGSAGLLWTASASGVRGNADGNNVTWTNTHVDAGEKVSMTSGSDTTLKGAVVSAPQITANVGNNLHIESLQDASRFDSKQQNIGGSISAGHGKMSCSLSVGKSNTDSDYASVQRQSGLRAGDQGFDVTVANDTDLEGGVITSTQAAIADSKNSFTTGGELSTSNIQNQASYTASSVGVNIGAGTSLDGKLAPQGTGARIGADSGNAGSHQRYCRQQGCQSRRCGNRHRQNLRRRQGAERHRCAGADHPGIRTCRRQAGQ